ncbi:MAG: hypothetical protein ABFE07_29190 [Armatimonadia bacterium]
MLKVIDLRPIPTVMVTVDPRDINVVKERILSSIKGKCYSGIFKHPTGNLANSIRAYVIGNSIFIYTNAPEAEAVEEGVRPHTMWYLLNKTIPIRTFEFGIERLTFRRASLKSYLRGAWRHPGTEGQHIFRDGIQEGLAQSSEELAGYEVTVRG